VKFRDPERLVLFVVVAAVVAGYLIQQFRRSQYFLRFSNTELLASVAPHHPGWRRHLAAGALVLALAGLTLGFARPTRGVKVPFGVSTVVLALDTSRSMEADDVKPRRFEAAKTAASQFVKGLPPRFQVGLVVFSQTASLRVLPGSERGSISREIATAQLADGTAIGDAIFVGLDAIRTAAQGLDRPAPGRIVLISDGETTSGRPNSEAIKAAKKANVPVSTIAFGTPNGTIDVGGRKLRVPVDKDALQKIADDTGGRSFEALSGSELKSVYSDIEEQIVFRIKQREITTWFVGAALLFALVAAGASLVWFSRLP
jgi:Ca-activated chloride channel family protein